jgi:hypothetical protein
MASSKWSNVFLVVLQKDADQWVRKIPIYDSANSYQAWYNVPKTRKFTNTTGETETFSFLDSQSLSPITLDDKLMIFAHGNEAKLGPFDSAADLCKGLYSWGLRKIGLITFKACLIGKGDFLEAFERQCSKPESSIEVGWLKGYCGSARTEYSWSSYLLPGSVLPIALSSKADQKPHEYVEDDSRWSFFYLSGKSRYKIVPGNTRLKASHGSRYITLEEVKID